MGLGKRVRHYRTKAGLTLAELSALSDVDVGTISALEQRDSSRSQYFPALAMALGMNVEALGDEGWDGTPITNRDPQTGHVLSVNLAGPLPFRPGRSWDSAPSQPPGAREPTPSYGMEPILAWEHPDDLPDGEFVMVPRLDVHLSPGGQVEIGLANDNPQVFSAEWVRQRRLKPGKLAAMRATGESMEPTVYDGDNLLIDTSQTDVVDGKVYALWYDGGERVRRLFRLPGGGLRIKSDNPSHGTIELGPDYGGHVRVIGRVVHRSSTGGL
jgi:phage repressor protein C with HTH and peptisase S24 domain